MKETEHLEDLDVWEDIIRRSIKEKGWDSVDYIFVACVIGMYVCMYVTLYVCMYVLET
jgi:hypothetical protein